MTRKKALQPYQLTRDEWAALDPTDRDLIAANGDLDEIALTTAAYRRAKVILEPRHAVARMRRDMIRYEQQTRELVAGRPIATGSRDIDVEKVAIEAARAAVAEAEARHHADITALETENATLRRRLEAGHRRQRDGRER